MTGNSYPTAGENPSYATQEQKRKINTAKLSSEGFIPINDYRDLHGKIYDFMNGRRALLIHSCSHLPSALSSQQPMHHNEVYLTNGIVVDIEEREELDKRGLVEITLTSDSRQVNGLAVIMRNLNPNLKIIRLG